MWTIADRSTHCLPFYIVYIYRILFKMLPSARAAHARSLLDSLSYFGLLFDLLCRLIIVSPPVSSHNWLVSYVVSLLVSSSASLTLDSCLCRALSTLSPHFGSWRSRRHPYISLLVSLSLLSLFIFFNTLSSLYYVLSHSQSVYLSVHHIQHEISSKYRLKGRPAQ